jgi:hypothetical protein
MHKWRILSSGTFLVPRKVYGVDTNYRGPAWAIARSLARANKIGRWHLKNGDLKGVFEVEFFKAPARGSTDVRPIGSISFEVMS